MLYLQPFIELGFHSIRQEKFQEGLSYVSQLIELCPGVVEQLDTVLNLTTSVSQLPSSLGGLASSGDGPNASVFASLFYKGHLEDSGGKKKKGRPRDRSEKGGCVHVLSLAGVQLHAPADVSIKGDEEAKRAAVRRAIQASSTHFVTPGPGHYHNEQGVTVLSTKRNAPALSFGGKFPDPALTAAAKLPGPAEYDTRTGV